ncbi:MAG: DUF4276 family protein [Bryobacteraceae bacterium]
MGKECTRGEAVTLIRLHVVVEGQTEEGFLNEVVAPELGALGIFIDTHSITTGRKRGRLFRGGWGSYGQLRRDLLRWMKQDQNPDAWFSTMVDLYGLPNDFPGHTECQKLPDPRQRVLCLEEHLALDIRDGLAGGAAHQRFIPYIQLHEFEALLFADPGMFLKAFPEEGQIVAQLQAIRARFQSPEHIDDGQATAPSKRILDLLPGYVKTVSGILILKYIGLDALRRECPHFNEWMAKIGQ